MPGPLDFIPQIAQAGLGIYQAIKGAGVANKAQKDMEGMVNSYQPNASILDYYKKASARYNVNAYDSATYRKATGDAQRNLSTGIGALQDRRSALSGVASMVRATNDAGLNAASRAEQEQAGQLHDLGTAAQVKAQEDFKPFEMKYNLLGQKAAGGNAMQSAGYSNLGGAATSAGSLMSASKMYGK